MNRYTVSMGCDPEFFFSNEDGVIGAEKVLPLDGITASRSKDYVNTSTMEGRGKVIIDGVQAELNPIPNTCRANLINEIARCFKALNERMANTDLKINVQGTVVVPPKEFKELSDAAKQFGCMPDINAYLNAENVITIDAKKSRQRTAGGHVHLGVTDSDVMVGDTFLTSDVKKAYGFNLHKVRHGSQVVYPYISGKITLSPVAMALQKHPDVIKVLDILLGNTCVLIDTDPLNVNRRKVYGKAGDFRFTPYGLEYRTLSNFWLKSSVLASMVFGIARTAVHVVANNLQDKLCSLVDEKDIVKAINENDYELAMKNLQKIMPFIYEHFSDSEHQPLSEGNMGYFLFFVSKKLEYWFKQDAFEHWCNHIEGHGCGFEAFLRGTVKQEYLKEVTE